MAITTAKAPLQVTASGGITVSLAKKPATHTVAPGTIKSSVARSPDTDPDPDTETKKTTMSTPVPNTPHSVPQTEVDEDEDLSSLEDETEDAESSTEDSNIHNPEASLKEDEDSLDVDEINNGVLEIYHAKCLSCQRLVPHADKKYTNCSFTKGNTRCPASSVQVLIGIPLDKIVTAFFVAEQTGDNARLGKLYAQLANKPAWQQQRITQALNERRAAQQTQTKGSGGGNKTHK